jgi:hypothetical protein
MTFLIFIKKMKVKELEEERVGHERLGQICVVKNW